MPVSIFRFWLPIRLFATSVPFFHTLGPGEKAARQWGRRQRQLYLTDKTNNKQPEPILPTGDSKPAELWIMYSMQICRQDISRCHLMFKTSVNSWCLSLPDHPNYRSEYASEALIKAFMLQSGKLEAVKVHYLVPHRYKVVQELLLGVLTSVNFCQGPELGV